MDDSISPLICSYLHDSAATLESAVTQLHAVNDLLEAGEARCKDVSDETQNTADALDQTETVFVALRHSRGVLHSADETFAAFDALLREVSRRVAVMSEIADQTNILAVNATLEAARAGERGKGFQVVADAMRALARASARSAQEIEDLLAEGGSRVELSRHEVVEHSKASEHAIDQGRAAFEDLNARTRKLQLDARALVDIFRGQNAELSRIREQVQRKTEDYSLVSAEILAALSGMPIHHVEPQDAASLVRKMMVVDVRTPEEFATDIGRIPGARNVPAGDGFTRGLAPYARQAPIMFVCRRGGRSARAARIALELGFQQVWNLKEGMEGWRAADLPTQTGPLSREDASA